MGYIKSIDVLVFGFYTGATERCLVHRLHISLEYLRLRSSLFCDVTQRGLVVVSTLTLEDETYRLSRNVGK
jgi:hypothetical protein